MIQLRIDNLTVLIIVLFQSVYGPCFWLQAGPPLSLAKSWSSARRAVENAHKFYSILFYVDVSTFKLSLIHF